MNNTLDLHYKYSCNDMFVHEPTLPLIGDMFEIDTAPSYDYSGFGYVSTSHKWLTFSVSSCAGAYIALRIARPEVDNPNPHNDVWWEIAINPGRSSNITIWESADGSRVTSQVPVLTCSSYQELWLRWDSRYITLSQGFQGSTWLLTKETTNEMSNIVSYVQFSSPDGIVASWKFRKDHCTYDYRYIFTFEKAF